MTSTILPRETLGTATVNAIRELILHGELPPGAPIRQEWLSARLGVSRIPVREALRQLDAEGLVVFAPHRGAMVPLLSPEEIGELYELRSLIEGDLLRRAVPHFGPADATRARNAVEELNHAFASEEVRAWGRLNWAFHAALYAPAGRPRTLAVAENLHHRTDRFSRMQLVLTHGRRQAQREHAGLLSRVRRGDASGAAALLRRHILGARDRLLQFLRQQQLPPPG